MGSEGREGDWECGGCRNRNYAFRLICNRCKQSRLLVDTKTPADSKWLPRIGDWICAGCSNNNYASREKCKKCGQAKEVAAMPAIAMPGLGASLPTYAHYFARAHGAVGLKMNLGIAGNSALQQSLSQTLNWSLGGHDKYGLQSAPGWLLGGNSSMGFSFANNANQLIVPKGWRTGDWICNCGFHNYSSRLQCKKCNASGPSCTPSIVSTAGYSEALKEALSALSRITCRQHVEVSVRNQGLRRVDIAALNLAHGTKRLAPDEFVSDWDNKRLNAGIMNNMSNHFLTRGSNNDQTPGAFSPCPNGSSAMTSNSDVQPQLSQFAAVPALIGKGAKQWRDGDWMCKNCNNHNFASRSHCNRCKNQKDAAIQSPLRSECNVNF